MSDSLPWPHNRTLEAAEGWMDLGLPKESWKEISRLPLRCRNHPSVLELQWQLYANEQDWTSALRIGKALKQAAPRRPSGWLHYAYALRRCESGGLQAAWEALLPAWDQFPSEPVVAYNLACYACQQGRLTDSMKWLLKSMKWGQKKPIKKLALQDEDLSPLWKKISLL